MYQFKFYYKDGTTKYVGGKGIRPTTLYNDFDGLLDWDDLYKLREEDMTTEKILTMAFDLYKTFLKKDYYRIEIVNLETNTIVDYIEKKETL